MRRTTGSIFVWKEYREFTLGLSLRYVWDRGSSLDVKQAVRHLSLEIKRDDWVGERMWGHQHIFGVWSREAGWDISKKVQGEQNQGWVLSYSPVKSQGAEEEAAEGPGKKDQRGRGARNEWGPWAEGRECLRKKEQGSTAACTADTSIRRERTLSTFHWWLGQGGFGGELGIEAENSGYERG